MVPEIDTKQITAVEIEVQKIYRQLYPTADHRFVPRAFTWARESFEGKFEDFQPIDAVYHDLEHTLQGALCLSRILLGRKVAGTLPPLPPSLFELALLAILFHDTGYLKRRSDGAGTGAKYTLIHVTRSVEFAGLFLSEKGFSPTGILAVQNMIRCTGVNQDLKSIEFQSDLERTLGFATGTADLLGQMAAVDYVEKLPILYLEFEESSRFSTGTAAALGSFSSAEDLLRKTPAFWQKYVLPKIEKEFQGVYRFLSLAHPEGRNIYLEKIEENIRRVENSLVPS